MKEHRWVVSVVMPALVQKNEDGEYRYYIRPPRDNEEWPKDIHCWDCELPAEEVFGKPCLGELDHRGFTFDAWEGIGDG